MLLVTEPAVGNVLPCGTGMLPFGCVLGQPIEVLIYHSDDPAAKPAVYTLTRIR